MYTNTMKAVWGNYRHDSSQPSPYWKTKFTRKHEIFYGGRKVGGTPFQTLRPIAEATG